MMCNPVFLKKHVDLICHERRCRLTVSIPHSVRSRRRIDTHSTFTFSSVISTSRRSMGSNGIGPSDWCGGPRFHRDPPRPIKGGYSQIIQTCDQNLKCANCSHESTPTLVRNESRTTEEIDCGLFWFLGQLKVSI